MNQKEVLLIHSFMLNILNLLIRIRHTLSFIDNYWVLTRDCKNCHGGSPEYSSNGRACAQYMGEPECTGWYCPVPKGSALHHWVSIAAMALDSFLPPALFGSDSNRKSRNIRHLKWKTYFPLQTYRKMMFI